MDRLLRIGKDNSTGILTSSTIYLIAAFAMLLDHAKHIGLLESITFNMIGRIAYPIFAYFIVVGISKTHNIERYIIRLSVAAILAEIPFNVMCTGQLFSLNYQNTIFELLIGTIGVKAIFDLKQKKTDIIQKIVDVGLIILTPLLAEALNCDYGLHGILLILAFAIFYNSSVEKLGILLSIVLVFCIGYESTPVLNIFNVTIELQTLSILSCIPLFLYNGKEWQGGNPVNQSKTGDESAKGVKTSSQKAFQIFKYIFYPGHLAVLCLIKLL